MYQCGARAQSNATARLSRLIATKEVLKAGTLWPGPPPNHFARGSGSHRHHFCESELDTGRRTRGLSGVIFNGRSDERHLCRAQPHLLEQLEHTTIHDITEQIFSERKG